jgi:protein-S-isoprenylcysteine O-methyltransferase Ste14
MVVVVSASQHDLWVKIAWSLLFLVVAVLGGRKYLADSEWERTENEEKYLTRCKESHNSYCCFCEKVPVLIPKSTTKTEGKKEQ